MVFKDLEGTKQARKDLAERESKMLLSLQGGKPPKALPKLKQKKTSLIGMIKASFEDFKQYKDMYASPDAGMSDFDAEVEILYNNPFGSDSMSEMNHLKELLETEFDSPAPQYTEYTSLANLSKCKLSPAYMAFQNKMVKVQKRKLLKSLILKHGSKQAELSLVDTALTEEQVDEMILTCLQLEEVKGMLGEMPEVDLFGEYGY